MDIETLDKKMRKDNYLYAKPFGHKVTLFRKLFRNDWLAEIIHPTDGVKQWPGNLEDFMIAIAEWSQLDRLWCFNIDDTDQAQYDISRLTKVDNMVDFACSLSRLKEMHGGATTVIHSCLTNESLNWLIIFDVRQGLEIAFYGPTAQADSLLATFNTPIKNRALDRIKKLLTYANGSSYQQCEIEILQKTIPLLTNCNTEQQAIDIVLAFNQAYAEFTPEYRFWPETDWLNDLQAIAQPEL